MTTVESLIEFLQGCDAALPVRAQTSDGEFWVSGFVEGSTAVIISISVFLLEADRSIFYSVRELIEFLTDCDHALPVEIRTPTGVCAIEDLSSDSDAVSLCSALTDADWDSELGLTANGK